MAERKGMSLRMQAVLAGLGFGLYYGLGLAYFEALPAGKGAEFVLWPYLLAFGLMTMVAGSVWMMVGKNVRENRGHPLVLVGLPILGLLIFGLVLSGLMMALGAEGGYFDYWGEVAGQTLLLSVLPALGILILLQGGGATRPSNIATTVSAAVQAPPIENEAASSAMLVLETGTNRPISIPHTSLLLVEAADNYCRIHFLETTPNQDQPESLSSRSELVRIKMKDLAEQLTPDHHFFRCHRSYIVHAKMIREISGNSQNQKIHLHHLELQVPVSRSFDTSLLQTYLNA